MTTLKGTYKSIYILESSKNPFTLGSTAYFDVPGGVAISGATGFSWSVTNYGKIVGKVDLAGGGTFINEVGAMLTGNLYLGAQSGGGSGMVTNSGSITGGVWLQDGGSVTNAASGVINGSTNPSGYGVGLLGAGTVTNAGKINGGKYCGAQAGFTAYNTIVNQSGGFIYAQLSGILLGNPFVGGGAGARVSNAATASIRGDSGVFAVGAKSTVTNSGTITGTADTTLKVKNFTFNLGDGVYLGAGGAVTNEADGVIQGARDGVYLKGGKGAVGTVTNDGSIYGGIGVKMNVAGGTVTNASGAKIGASGAGNSGIELLASGTVVNQGSISATNGHFDGGIRLMAGGTATNSGMITVTGQYVTGIGLYAGGSATNTGTIKASGQDLTGVFLNAGGAFTNSGKVIALDNSVYAADGGTISNAQGGVIIGATGIGAGVGYVTVSNAGLVEGAGAWQNGVWLGGGGKVTNSSTGLITAAGSDLSGVVLGATGTVTNAGTISAAGESDAGVALNDGGTVTNSGSITASGFYVSAVYLKEGGTLTNSGSIVASGAGGYSGVYSKLGGAITNSATGVISGSNAIFVTVKSATVVNYGKLTGGNGVYLQAGGTVVNHAGGTIVGTVVSHYSFGYGVAVAAAGGVTNYGAITGVYAGAAVANPDDITNQKGATIVGKYLGVVLENRFSSSSGATLTNIGSITGDTGVADRGSATSAADKIVNSGAITGTTVTTVTFNGPSLKLGDGVGLFDGGAVTNQTSGAITGARYGVYVTGGAGSVTNAGEISGAKGSVDFTGAGANALTLQSGAELIGAAIGSTASGATNSLILQGGGTAANLFENFTTLTVASGANWTLTADSMFGSTTIDGQLTVNDGLTGPVTVTNGGVAIFDSAVTGAFTFIGTGELELGAAFGGTISGFAANDVFDLLAFKKSTTTFGFSENGANSQATLTFTQAGTATETLTLAGAYTKNDFALSAGANDVGLVVKFV